MRKEVKESLLYELRNDETYLSLAGVKSESEKRQIRAFVEDVYLCLIEGVLNVDEALSQAQDLVEPDDEQIPSEQRE
jgi:hypothetical protein